MQRLRKVLPFDTTDDVTIATLCIVLDAGQYPLNTPLDVIRAVVGTPAPREGTPRGDWYDVMVAYTRLEQRMAAERKLRRPRSSRRKSRALPGTILTLKDGQKISLADWTDDKLYDTVKVTTPYKGLKKHDKTGLGQLLPDDRARHRDARNVRPQTRRRGHRGR